MVDNQCAHLFRDLWMFFICSPCAVLKTNGYVFPKSIRTSWVVCRRERRRWRMLQSSDLTLQAMKECKTNTFTTTTSEQILMCQPIFELFLSTILQNHIARAITLGLKMALFLRHWRTLGNLLLRHRWLNKPMDEVSLVMLCYMCMLL